MPKLKIARVRLFDKVNRSNGTLGGNIVPHELFHIVKLNLVDF